MCEFNNDANVVTCYEMKSAENVEVEDEMETCSKNIVKEDNNIEFIGKVVNCDALRVRSEPNTDSEILTEINNGKEVVVDGDCSTEDFYKVYTESGVEGFCIREYIELQD